MFYLYFKQAWNLIRQERLFSLIYIVGTGLSVSMVMVLSIVFYLKTANIYPETNRDRTLVAKNGMVTRDDGSMSSSSLSEKVIEKCFGSLQGLEAIGLVYNNYNEFMVQPEGRPEQIPVSVKFVNTGFWQVFPFQYQEGKAFTEADQQSGIRTVVLAQSLAQRLFGKEEEAVGRDVSLNFSRYRVCGVVKDASYVTSSTFAQLYLPYTAAEGYDPNRDWEESGSLGRFNAYILASPGTNVRTLKAEAESNIERYSRSLKGMEFKMLGQPDHYWQSIFRTGGNQAPDFGKLAFQYSLIFLVLLLIPSVSLSGMTDSRMERRLAEMGVRRAFGAPVMTLMKQIVSENFLFTMLGGMCGLIFSYLLLFLTRSWIMQIAGQASSALPPGVDVVLTPAMLMNFQVFGIALSVCFLLNLLSALIPAWRAAHRHIIYSLNAK